RRCRAATCWIASVRLIGPPRGHPSATKSWTSCGRSGCSPATCIPGHFGIREARAARAGGESLAGRDGRMGGLRVEWAAWPRGEYACDAREWLLDVSRLPLDDALLDDAATLGPANLRSLDAIHLATAIGIREEIGAFITYDRRLAQAAQASGLPVVTPGAVAV